MDRQIDGQTDGSMGILRQIARQEDHMGGRKREMKSKGQNRGKAKLREQKSKGEKKGKGEGSTKE